MDENKIKYGDPKNDIIAQSLKYSPDFCVFNILKYTQRVLRVSKLPFFKKWYYRIVKGKGGVSDEKKVWDYYNRVIKQYPAAASWAMKERIKLWQESEEEVFQ